MNASVRVHYGNCEFSAEGPAEWVAEQYDKFLAHLDAKQAIEPKQKTDVGAQADQDQSKVALGSFLKKLGATENQSKKLLATAVWLHGKGSRRLKTGEITQALRDNNQARLGNASQCLANNVSQGFIEREGDTFFVTDEGRDSMSKSD
jgi:hypothetical protein